MDKLLFGLTLLASISSFASNCESLSAMRSNLDPQNTEMVVSTGEIDREINERRIEGKKRGDHNLSIEADTAVLEARLEVINNTSKANTKSIAFLDESLKVFCGILND